jgi:hypothetical protein
VVDLLTKTTFHTVPGQPCTYVRRPWFGSGFGRQRTSVG